MTNDERQQAEKTIVYGLRVRLAAALGDVQQRTEEAQEAAAWKAAHSAERFKCLACMRGGLAVDAMEQVRPGTYQGTCKPCYKFMWGAGSMISDQYKPLPAREVSGRVAQLNAERNRGIGR